MSAAVHLDPARPVLDQLRERVTALESGPARASLPTHPALAGLLQLRAGSSYGVDSASLCLALAGAASQAGEWVGVVGWADLGAEAAAGLGVEPSRTVVVPDPGELWLEVTAALVDVARVVILKPAGRVEARTAGVVEARLRRRGSALVVWGDWPGCEARLSLEGSRWTGPRGGHGRLLTRQARIAVRRGSAPPRRVEVDFPGPTSPLELSGLSGLSGRDEVGAVPLRVVAAG